MGLSVEQEDILNAVELYEDGEEAEADMISTALITDSEIIALLEQPGIDIEALTSTYSELTRQYIIDLQRTTRERRGDTDRKGKRNKKRRKKRHNVFANERAVDANDGQEKKEDGDDEEENVERFMKQFT